MAILLSDNELGALAGLPHSAIVLYIALRTRMDFRTGYVGVRPRISWQGLYESCYVEPHPGLSEKSPSASTLRRLAGWLERAGLVVQLGSKEARTLVFSCPLASLLSHAQKQPDSNPTDQHDRPNARNSKDFEEKADKPETVQADIHRCTGEKPSVYQSSSSSELSVGSGPQGGRDDPQEEYPPKGGQEGPQGADQPLPDQITLFPDQSPSKASVEGDVVFPSSLSDDQRRGIMVKTARLGERQQAVIDELAGHMAKRPIDNPIRYVDFIISKALLPLWVPELAGAVRAARERAAQVRDQRAAPPAPAARPIYEKRPDKAAELFQQLKGALRATQ